MNFCVKNLKFIGILFLGIIVLTMGYLILRGLSNHLDGAQVWADAESPNGSLTARSATITEYPFFGKERNYYRFELREGRSSIPPYGRILKEATMNPIPGETFLTPGGRPSFSVEWNENQGSVRFTGKGIDLTLKK